jgi:hypothetical protein
MIKDQFTKLPIKELLSEDPELLTFSQAQKKLNKPCAFWLLTTRGEIFAANILAAWLWEVGQLNSNTFFGVNVFEIFSRHHNRIPTDQNDEFFKKKIQVLNRLIRGYGRKPYKNFLRYVQTDLHLREMLKKKAYIPDEQWETDRIWEYSLKLFPPRGTNFTEYLDLHVTIYRLYPSNEFLGIYEPHPRSEITQSLFYEKFLEAKNVSDLLDYVQYQNGIRRGEKIQIPMKSTNHLDIDKSTFEKVLVAVANIRERQLEDLALKDPPSVVTEDLLDELEAFKKGNVGRKSTYDGTTSS